MAQRSTVLLAQSIPSVSSANRIFGSNTGLMLARPARSCCKPWITIPEGFYCLVTSHGADIDYVGASRQPSAVWPAGKHAAAPWQRVSAIVTQQSIVFDTPVKGCRTKDNVSVEIDIAIVLRVMGDPARGEDPELVRRFVHELGPNGLQNQLADAQEEAVRALARSVTHEEVYGLRSNPGRARNDAPDGEYKGTEDAGATDAMRQRAEGVTDDFKRALNDQFNRLGVQISDVIIEDVRLPDNFVEQMSEKTVMLATIKEQRWKQKYDMQQLEMKEDIATLDQRKEEERLRVAQEEEAACLDVEMQLRNNRAQTAAVRAEIDTESYKINNVLQADADLEAMRLREEKEQLISGMRAASECEAAAMRAEADKYVEVRIAEAELQVQQNESRAFQIRSEAEGRASSMLAAKRRYEEDEKRMEIFSSLTQNPELILSADDSSNINNLLLCDRILDKRASATHTGATKSQILAEMLVTQRQAEVMSALRASAE